MKNCTGTREKGELMTSEVFKDNRPLVNRPYGETLFYQNRPALPVHDHDFLVEWEREYIVK